MPRQVKMVAVIVVASLLVIAECAIALPGREETTAQRMWKEQLPEVKKLLESWDGEFADITIAIFDELYGREKQLDLRTRELCTVTVLTCLGRPEELDLHLFAALNVGWTFEELREIMILSCIPAGWPSSLDALRYLCEWCKMHQIPTAPPLRMRQNYGTKDWYQTGYDKGVELFGDRSWKEYLNELFFLDPQLANFVVVNLYGKLLTRSKLDDRTRELCYVAAFAALKDKQNLKLHIRGALNSGALSTEVEEVLFHIGCYAGMGAVSQAISVYREMG